MATKTLIALLLATGAAVAMRPDAPAISQAQAAAMSPAALGDALLAAGHPPIVERQMLPDTGAPPPPRPDVAPLDVRLFAAAALDRTSGFCVKRSWQVTGTPGGRPQHVAMAPTLYRLPPATGGCEAPRFMSYFAVAPTDRPRAFTIVRLLADAIAHPARMRGKVRIDGIEAPMPALPIDRLFAARRYIVTPQLSKAELTGPDGRPRENWELYVGDHKGGMVWTIHLALDGDRIALMRLDHHLPAPF